MMANIFTDAILVGLGATTFKDMVAWAQKHTLKTPSLDYGMVGRWLGRLTNGKIIHGPISSSQPIAGERLLGWIAHHIIGVVFSVSFIAVHGSEWLENPDPLPAVVFGLMTVLFLLLQPGLGAGFAARRTPNPNIVRLKSLFTPAGGVETCRHFKSKTTYGDSR